MPERLCLYEACPCRPEPDEDYCSRACADADGAERAHRDHCPCGHPECRPENAREYDPRERVSPFRPQDVTNE
jgi:hypothetical protein